MTRDRISSRALVVALAALAIGGVACDKKQVTKPPPATPLASLATIWPNEDGRGWTYSFFREEWEDTARAGLFVTAGAVPPAPSLPVLRALIPTLGRGPSVTTDSASFSLRFSGQITTGSGVVAQYLQTTIGPPVSAGLAGAGRVDPILAHVWQARADLRSALESRLSLARPLGEPSPHLFLSGGAWRKTASAILGYGDFDTLPSWKYLDSNIVPGAQFTLQLIPSLASDVFLHGRIAGRKSVTTPSGTYPNAIECEYMVNYGIAAMTDDQGGLLGYQRSVSYGTVAYVDSLGPVACSERLRMRVVSSGAVTNGVGTQHSSLRATVPPPLPGLRRGLTTWRRP